MSVGDFTLVGRADACLPVERCRGIRAPFATVLGRVRRRTAGVRAYFCVFTHRPKERGGRSRPVLFWPFETPVSPGSPMLPRFWAKVCQDHHRQARFGDIEPDIKPARKEHS